MKAVRLHAYGDIDQFRYEEVPDPVPGPGEVLVKVAASTVNPVEIWLRQGFLAQMMPLALPAILGVDVAGTVVQVGPEIAGYRVGDRVVGKLPIDSKGSNAELVATEPKYLAKLPETIGFTEGVALPVAGLTSRQAVDSLGVKAGDRVLVTGALGAVGRAAVQYIKELGAVPVAGVRSARVGEAKALGIEAFSIDEPGASASFDAAVETIGGAIAAAAIGLVRDGGALASVAGLPEGANADGRIRIVSVYAVEDAAMLRKVVDAAATGTLKIPVAKTFRLSEVGEAHRLMAAGQVGGKIVLIP